MNLPSREKELRARAAINEHCYGNPALLVGLLLADRPLHPLVREYLAAYICPPRKPGRGRPRKALIVNAESIAQRLKGGKESKKDRQLIATPLVPKKRKAGPGRNKSPTIASGVTTRDLRDLLVREAYFRFIDAGQSKSEAFMKLTKRQFPALGLHRSARLGKSNIKKITQDEPRKVAGKLQREITIRPARTRPIDAPVMNDYIRLRNEGRTHAKAMDELLKEPPNS